MLCMLMDASSRYECHEVFVVYSLKGFSRDRRNARGHPGAGYELITQGNYLGLIG